MICSSGVTIFTRGASFPRLPVKKAPEFNVIKLRNHLPSSLTPLRRSSSPSSALIPMRLQSSLQILTSRGIDQTRDFFSLQKLKRFVRVIQALIVFLLLPVQSVVSRRSKRKILCIGETSNDEFILSSPSIPPNTEFVRRDLAIKRILEDKSCDGSSIRDFSLFKTKRGETLFTQSWTPVDSIENRGLVVLLHGLNEHSSRYNDFAKQLNLNGFKVYGIDWIGHGGSDGLHAYVPSLDYVVSDLSSFLDKVIAENPGLPCFCIGHSTGGAIILKAMLDPKIESQVSGIVLTSPAIGVRPSHPIIAVIAPVLSFLVPQYQLTGAEKKRVVVTRDPEALVAKYSDPLVYTGSVRARTGYEILRVCSHLQRNLKRIKIPFLVLHGTSDTVTDPKATQKLYNEASSSDKSIKLFDGFLHDLLFEPERQIVVGVILDWLNRRV